MTDVSNVYAGELAWLSDVEFEAPLADAKESSCTAYFSVYTKAAEEAKQSGDAKAEAVMGFLANILSFHPNYDAPSSPYVPFFQIEGRRGYMPSDLSADDIAFLRDLTGRAQDPVLLARTNDLLWVLTKDHTACSAAATNYVSAGARLVAQDVWSCATDCYRRALQLASKLGRDKALYKEVEAGLVETTRGAASATDNFVCCNYMNLLLEFRCGDPAEFAAIANGRAKMALAKGDFSTARGYYMAEADFLKISQKSDEERTARLEAAETYVTDSEARVAGNDRWSLAAAAILIQGIEALRRAGAERERVDALRKRLAEHQQASVKHLHPISTTVDLSEMVAMVREHVMAGELAESLRKFAFGHPLCVPDKMRAQVIEIMREFPLQHLFTSVQVDGKRRPTDIRKGLVPGGGEDSSEAIEAEMFANAARFSWPLRVVGYIDPGRLQILNDHHPTMADLQFAVVNNPFVPPGHEVLFLRGIHAGFEGDFVVASHLLVPQIENSLCYVLESNGIDVSNLMSDGTQPVKMLGTILALPATLEIFGEDLCFELRGCLIEKRGFDFRNRLAHGFVTESECFTTAPVLLWWLVLRTCLIPVFKSQVKAE